MRCIPLLWPLPWLLTQSSIRPSGGIAVLGISLLLGACTPTASYWSEAQSPKHNQVETVRLVHDLPLATPTAPLASADYARLDAFLARHNIGHGDRIAIVTAGTGPTAQRNLSMVQRHLAVQGIDTDTVMTGPGSDAPASGFRLVAEKFVVVPPNCPDWRKPGTSDYGNTPMSNLGCANAVNLGLMLANPRDLIQGREMGDADGTASALAIQRYRADKIKPLDRSGTTE